MEIRKIEPNDIESLVNLWLETSLIAHDFIPASHWIKNKDAMASVYLPESETYLAVVNNKAAGFVSMSENYLAAIFVDTGVRDSGICPKLSMRKQVKTSFYWSG